MTASESFDRYCEIVEDAMSAYDQIRALERQLESARSIAIDRDQRLARIKELVTTWTGDAKVFLAASEVLAIAEGKTA